MIADYILAVGDDGTLSGVYSDDLRDLYAEGETTIKRASSVEPAVGGGWEADLAPVAGPKFVTETRAEAIAQEVRWINSNVIEKPKA